MGGKLYVQHESDSLTPPIYYNRFELGWEENCMCNTGVRYLTLLPSKLEVPSLRVGSRTVEHN